MADLSLAADEMVDRICDLMGWESPTDDQSAQALAWLNDGYRRFLRGGYYDAGGLPQVHTWNFLRPWATLSLPIALAQNATGVYDADSDTTTVTAVSAVFYPWCVGRDIALVDGSVDDFTITGYTSTTVVTASGDNSWTGTKGIGVEHSGLLDLPAGFGGMEVNPVYAPDYDTALPNLRETSPEQVMAWHRDNTVADDPTMYAIFPKDFTASTGQRWRIFFAPHPYEARIVNYRYRILADALTDSASDYPVGGADFCDVILQAGRAAAETSEEAIGPEERRYREMLAHAILMDSTKFAAAGRIERLTDVDVGMGV